MIDAGPRPLPWHATRTRHAARRLGYIASGGGVAPFASELTPVGQVMALFSAHTDGRLVSLPGAAFEGDLDALATCVFFYKLSIETMRF